MSETLPRLCAILTHLPLDGLPPRALEVGCGDFSSAYTLRAALPGWMILGVDRDGNALRHARLIHPSLHRLQADARDLPALFRPLHGGFGLILIRHPDLFRSRAAWSRAIPALPVLLAPGGILLITLYAPEEAAIIRALPLPFAAFNSSPLPHPDLAGRDRFVLLSASVNTV